LDGPLRSEDGDGVSVLHVACQLADNDDVIGHLLSSGALVNARDRRGRTPLHYAVDTDQPRYCGVTPLTDAAFTLYNQLYNRLYDQPRYCRATPLTDQGCSGA